MCEICTFINEDPEPDECSVCAAPLAVPGKRPLKTKAAWKPLTATGDETKAPPAPPYDHMARSQLIEEKSIPDVLALILEGTELGIKGGHLCSLLLGTRQNTVGLQALSQS